MRQVEPDVHHAHYHALSRIGPGQGAAPLIRLPGIENGGHRVGLNAVGATGLDAPYAPGVRQRCQPGEWDAGYPDVPFAHQRLTTV
ncbi:MAG: hypothetical protein ACFN27_04845, partial [Prevotella sp.]